MSASCFKHVCNWPECSLNISEDEVGYQEYPTNLMLWLPKCFDRNQ